MHFIAALPVDHVEAGDEFCSGEAIAEIARAAERLGFHAVYTTEHPLPERRWLEAGGHHAMDPFVALSFAAAATTRLRVLTNLMVLSYRSPVLAAKSAASLDVLSGGRLTLGVGAGYMEPEFRALGVDFAGRNDTSDEALAVMQQIWTQDWIDVPSADGGTTQNGARPKPAQQPHPPIWMGGNSKRALRRAARFGQGWMPMPAPKKMAERVRTAALTSLDDLRGGLAYLHEHADAAGRSGPFSVMFMSLLGQTVGTAGFDASAQVDEAGAMAEAGVTHQLSPLARLGGGSVHTRGEYIERMERFAEGVIAKL